MVSLTLSFGCLMLQSEPANFQRTTYAEALAKARSEERLMFLDFYTDWCYWCKVLDRKVYTDTAVAHLLNTKFVSLKIDAEKGEGPALDDRLNVSGYPTVILLDPKNEEEIDRFRSEALQVARERHARRARLDALKADNPWRCYGSCYDARTYGDH